tara:strand:+ start:321 stop:608 length:288 start_codon:yes stop_codon:yes gene_type:complete
MSPSEHIDPLGTEALSTAIHLLCEGPTDSHRRLVAHLVLQILRGDLRNEEYDRLTADQKGMALEIGLSRYINDAPFMTDEQVEDGIKMLIDEDLS